MSTLVGDVFLSSAFMAYAGYFDQQSRQNLFTAWKHHLDMANLYYRQDMARTEFLSDPGKKLEKHFIITIFLKNFNCSYVSGI